VTINRAGPGLTEVTTDHNLQGSGEEVQHPTILGLGLGLVSWVVNFSTSSNLQPIPTE